MLQLADGSMLKLGERACHAFDQFRAPAAMSEVFRAILDVLRGARSPARRRSAFGGGTISGSLLLRRTTQAATCRPLSGDRNAMIDPIRVLGICGGLCCESRNSALLRTATQLQPETSQQFKTRIATDALLIATPEYNFAIFGVLDSAADWASRARLHLREMGAFNSTLTVKRPEIQFQISPGKFGRIGHWRVATIRQLIRELLVAPTIRASGSKFWPRLRAKAR